MAENRKKVLLSFELKCSDQGQKRIIKAMADFNPEIPNSLITNYSAEYDESESVNKPLNCNWKRTISNLH
jgi:hypothetical protein